MNIHGEMRIEAAFGGWSVHWPAPEGESLQGWYTVEVDALAAYGAGTYWLLVQREKEKTREKANG